MQTSVSPRRIASRFAAAAAVAVVALGAASAAHARNDISWSIGISTPGVYVGAGAPVYVPPPVYVQPRPVYVQPRPVYVQPQPVYIQQPPVYYYGGGRDWRRAEWERRQWQHRHHGRDWGRDGR